MNSKDNDPWAALGHVVTGVKQYFSSAKISHARNLEHNPDLIARYNRCKQAVENADSYNNRVYDFTLAILQAAEQDLAEEELIFREVPQPIMELIIDITAHAIKKEGFFLLPEIDVSKPIALSEQIALKKNLTRVEDWALVDVYAKSDVLWYFCCSLRDCIKSFVRSIEPLMSASNEDENTFTVDALYFAQNLSQSIETMLNAIFCTESDKFQFHESLKNTLLRNMDVVSGYKMVRTTEERNRRPADLPTEVALSGRELVDGFLKNSYLHDLFDAQAGFSLPLKLRMEHCHILAGTGHGKTQLLQRLILDDLNQDRGFMVIDSQGDIIRTLSMLKQFDPAATDSLADRLIVIDPEDVDYPASLNMFSLDTDGKQLSNLHKQMLINSTTEMYEYMFGALFGAELTSKQGVIFKYIAKLMAEIPDATIHTLRELLENGKQFKPYMERLDVSGRAFFETQFFTTSFGQTKKQILSRLWSVLSNQTLANLFSSKTNKIDMFEATNSGKIVLINTSKQLLQPDGSQILGRFFIALVAQAVIKRASLPENQRRDFMVYVDEAHEYFDEKFESMLNSSRKYNVGFTLAHQNISQLGSMKDTVFSSTSIKLAGGVSAKDATDMAREMHSSSDFILSMKKNRKGSSFACYLKNELDHAIGLSFEFGALEQLPDMSESSYGKLIDQLRSKYCVPIEVIEQRQEQKTITPKADDREAIIEPPSQAKKVARVEEESNTASAIEAPEVKLSKAEFESEKSTSPTKRVPTKVIEAPKSEHGLMTPHRFTQNKVLKFAKQRGFHAVAEAAVIGGHGFVDVSLSGYDLKIAVEISSTTGANWESSNISKCFAAGFDYTVVIATDPKHLSALQKALNKEFSSYLEDKVLRFFSLDELIIFLDEIRASSSSTQESIAGYTVKTSFSSISDEEAKQREAVITKVLMEKKG